MKENENWNRRTRCLPSKKAGRGPTFESSVPGRGSCTLLCHGEDHNNKAYPEGDDD